ncbi:hypothetical protein CRYUN_Cryun11dG0012600 [Craigia yunnanensis]
MPFVDEDILIKWRLILDTPCRLGTIQSEHQKSEVRREIQEEYIVSLICYSCQGVLENDRVM